MELQGRHRGDVLFGDLPPDVEPGDYWRYVNEDGSPKQPPDTPEYESNLTRTVWGICQPNRRAGIGTLMKHTVREHEDGTCSIEPGDGSSNSVLITGGGTSWHGYLRHGVWQES